MRVGLAAFSHRRVHCLLLLSLLCFAPSQIPALQGDDEVTPEVQNLYAQAREARQRGDDPTAIEKYKAIIKLAPHLAAAYNNLGMLYFNGQDYARAAQVLDRGLQLNSNMPGAAAMLGMSYFQLGQNDKAQPLLEKALRANPKEDMVEMVLVKVLISAHKLPEAVEHLNNYLARNPKSQDAWYLLGKAHLQLSEDALKRINEIDPDSVVAHEIAGEIDASMHNYDLALVEYKKAIDKAPDAPGYGRCLLEHGEMAIGPGRVSGGTRKRPQQLRSAVEAGQRNSRGERFERRGLYGTQSRHRSLSHPDAGTRGSGARIGQNGQALRSAARSADGREGKSARTDHSFSSRGRVQGARKERRGADGDEDLRGTPEGS
jgi:tetratricopeptide (TPR) repeat protein